MSDDADIQDHVMREAAIVFKEVTDGLVRAHSLHDFVERKKYGLKTADRLKRFIDMVHTAAKLLDPIVDEQTLDGLEREPPGEE
jgi:hypothetical protein